MNITLYNYIGLYNKYNKTTILSTATKISKTCTLKDGSSVLYPYIILTDDSDELSLSDVNYAYIPLFKRYYFVEVDSISNKLWVLRLSVDALYSYRLQLSGSRLVLEREYGIGEYYNELTDDYMEFKNQDNITISEVVNDATTTYKNWNLDIVSVDAYHTINVSGGYAPDGKYNVVMNAINKTIHRHSLPDISSPIGCLPKVARSVLGDNLFNYQYLGNISDVIEMENLMIQSTYPSFSYVKNIIVYPFYLEPIKDNNNDVEKVQVILGDDTTNLYLARPTDAYTHLGYMITNEFTISLPKEWVYKEPYSKYEIYIPFVGWCDIASADFNGCKLISVYLLNTMTGEGTNYLVNTTKNYIIMQQDCKMGIQLGLSRDNQQQINEARISNAISTAIGLLGSVASIGLGVVASNPTAIVGGVISGTKTIGSGVTSQMSMHSQALSKGLTSYGATFSTQKIYLKRTYKQGIYDPVAYNYVIGRKTGTIDELGDIETNNPDNTFIKCKDVKLSDTSATKQEQEMIFNLLKTGVYL